MDPTSLPAVVLDCGTGYTKLGYAGNVEPAFTLPTCIAACGSGKPSVPASQHDALSDLDFFIGHEAQQRAASHALQFPVRHGLVENWDLMEKFYQQCIYKYLNCCPDSHNFLLTEPPMNPPENRELMAEIMFETFNVPGLMIGVQAVLALYATTVACSPAKGVRGRSGLSGVVVDSGDGVTHVIPVVDSYVIGSAIRSMPLAGADITAFVQQLLRERGEPVPPDMSFDVAQRIKERYCYICSNLPKEFSKHDADPSKYVKQYTDVNSRTNTPFTVDVGYERFLGPELLFSPDIYSSQHSTPLPAIVDSVVQACPIDARRVLYNNVVLSGGTTMFKDFGRRLERDVQNIVKSRLPAGATAVDVSVMSHEFQRYAVWFGGSVLAATPDFAKAVKTREDYAEYGPSVCRQSYVFMDQ